MRKPPPLDDMAAALFLDVDGTLAPIEIDPLAVAATPRRTALLKDLSRRLGGRVAAISGRPLADVDRILGGATPAAAGLHGLERRDARLRHRCVAPHPAISTAVDRLRALTRCWRGLLLEAKGASVALHYRSRPDLESHLIAEAMALSAETGLECRRGAMVVELRTPGPHKGDALCAFMAEPPFKGACAIYVGDDLTDEDGFAAAASLGGFGVMVGPDRATQAIYRLDDVDAVLEWLETRAAPGRRGALAHV
jgi:trehalose 6-phosphate phosphatase